jgi:L-iditol 2-dehydrogenase
VTGLGFVGLLTVGFARLAGAGRVVATDLLQKRRELAVRLGADLALDPRDADVGDRLRNADGTGSFDVAFETSSSFEALTDAMRALRRNGRVCIVSQLKGAYPTHPTLGIEFHLDELEMISADGRGDVRKLARWYFAALQRGDLPELDTLFTHRVPFERIAEGFELLEREPENVVKVLVTYD